MCHLQIEDRIEVLLDALGDRAREEPIKTLFKVFEEKGGISNVKTMAHSKIGFLLLETVLKTQYSRHSTQDTVLKTQYSRHSTQDTQHYIDIIEVMDSV